jgi:shikimate dehydrogenase
MIRLGLVGYPLAHSLSPAIHAAALRLCELEGDYSLFPVPPGDLRDLLDLLVRLRTSEIRGLNVTIPHKQTVIPLLDELTPAARAIGAVNTICAHDGRLIGDNTDAPGFLADLKRSLNPLDGRAVLVLGAGGSARAVVYALLGDGWQVTVAARNVEQAMVLSRQFPEAAGRIAQVELQDKTLAPLLSGQALVVNATPVGMSPDVDASPWPAGLDFPKHAGVYDLVYNPRETVLVSQARRTGLRAVTGLGMLVEQAALAFELWTGREVPRDVLFEAVN